MSVSKIEQDIKLLENKLKEVDTTITDLIKRNEYQKELQRKIKKLERTKNSLEQLNREQQSLNSLKYDFYLNDNESTDKQKYTIDKQAEIILSSENNQPLETNEEKRTSSILPIPSIKTIKIAKFFAICSVLFTLSFLGLRYIKNRSISSANSLFTQEKAIKIVMRWYESKKTVFAPPYDRNLASKLLTGKSYERTVIGKDYNLSPIDWLQDNNKYYTFQLQKIDDIVRFQAEDNRASIDLIVMEQRTFCYQNSQGEIKMSNDDNTILDTSLERYYFSKAQGEWKITDYQTLERLERSKNHAKSCMLNY